MEEKHVFYIPDGFFIVCCAIDKNEEDSEKKTIERAKGPGSNPRLWPPRPMANAHEKRNDKDEPSYEGQHKQVEPKRL